MAEKSGAIPQAHIPAWERELGGRGLRAQCFEQCESTMDAARVLAQTLQNDEHGIVIARAQTQGRGRRGRTWLMAEDGFYCTYAFKIERGAEFLAGFSLVAGIAVAETLAALGAKTALKWPNDIMDNAGRKLGGILIESSSAGAQTIVLVGIGVNLAGAPAEVAEAAALGRILERSVTPLELALELSPRLTAVWNEFGKRGFAPFKENFHARALYLNSAVTLVTSGAERNGVYRGVNEKGELLLETDGVIAACSTGEFHTVRPA